MPTTRQILLGALLPALTAIPSTAQRIWPQLVGEGQLIPGSDTVPGFDPVDTVRSNALRDVSVAPNGSYVLNINTDQTQDNSGGAGTKYLAGSTDRGLTFRALRRETTIGGVVQENLGSFASITNDGTLFYTASHAGGTEPTGLWRDDTLLFEEGDQILLGPLAGSFLDSVGRPARFSDGTETWLSSYSATSGGPTVGTAFFRGIDTFEPFLQSGESIGAGLIAEPELTAGNSAWSVLGTNHLTNIKVAPTPGLNNPNNFIDQAVALNGQVLTVAGGGILHEGEPIPTAAGGLPNQTWAPGSLVAVNEAGDWAISASARIDGVGNTTEDFIVMNGEIVFRDGGNDSPGMIVDGHELTGLPQHLSLNDRGDLAFVWDNKAFVNGKIVAEAGDLVDADGDGLGDVLNFGSGDIPVIVTHVFDIELSNLPSGDPDGLPAFTLTARKTGNLEFIARNGRVTLTGDYNGDGLVDAADYTVWRDTEGSAALLAADGDQDNVVGAGDRTVWSDSFGTAAGSALTVPEPTTLLLAATAFAALGAGRQKSNRDKT